MNDVAESRDEILRSPLFRTLREASYRMTIHTPNQQRRMNDIRSG